MSVDTLKRTSVELKDGKGRGGEGFSLFQLMLYYMRNGIFRRFLKGASGIYPLWSFRFVSEVLRWGFNGKLFKTLPNDMSSLQDLKREPLTDVLLVNVDDVDGFLQVARRSASNGFVAVSYCQRSPRCPYPRFSDRCAAIYRTETLSCETCEVREVFELADLLGFPKRYMVTNSEHAMNLLFSHVSKLADERRGGELEVPFVISTCPLVARLIYAMAPLLGLKGIILPIGGGVCRDLREFDLAERGIKEGATKLLPGAKAFLRQLKRKEDIMGARI